MVLSFLGHRIFVPPIYLSCQSHSLVVLVCFNFGLSVWSGNITVLLKVSLRFNESLEVI